MPQIDLSTLDAPELRRLLDSTRRQGQAAQSYEILQEMEARRQRGPRPLSLSPKRRGAKPRMISVELGDPLDPKDSPVPDEDGWDLPPLTLSDDAPREAPPPEPELFHAEPPRAKAQGWAHWGALIFAIGLGGGVAAGWWAAGGPDGKPAPAAPPLQAAPPRISAPRLAVQTAALTPAIPPANADLPTAPAAAETAPATTPIAVTPSPAPAAPPASPSPDPGVGAQTAADTTPEPAPAAKPVETASAEDAACGSAPADRAICADPKLRRLQGQLRGAYAEALKAHEDRALLRQRELAWAEARNDVTDPEALATLYRQRIEKLRAATADALRRREAPPLSPRTAARPAP